MWLPLAMPLCKLYPEFSSDCEPCSVTSVQIDYFLVLVLVLVLISVDIWSQAPPTRKSPVGMTPTAAIYRSCRVLGTFDEEGFVLPLLR